MKKGTKLKKAIKCLRPTDLEALQSRMRGKKLREIAEEQGITEMGAHQRVQRAAKTLGLENIDQIRKDLFDDTFDDFHRSIKKNLQRLEPSVTNAYGKGFQVFRDKSELELSGKLTVEELAQLRSDNLAKGLKNFGLKVKK